MLGAEVSEKSSRQVGLSCWEAVAQTVNRVLAQTIHFLKATLNPVSTEFTFEETENQIG